MICQNQTLETQKTMRSQFEQLHQVLYDEESARLAALKKEEDEKIAAMKERIKKLSEEVLSVTETISVIQSQLVEDSMVLLKVCAFLCLIFLLWVWNMTQSLMCFFFFQNFKATQDR